MTYFPYGTAKPCDAVLYGTQAALIHPYGCTMLQVQLGTLKPTCPVLSTLFVFTVILKAAPRKGAHSRAFLERGRHHRCHQFTIPHFCIHFWLCACLRGMRAYTECCAI